MGLEDVSKYPALFASLLASGAWSLDDLKKLAGLNFLRVFREVEKVITDMYFSVFGRISISAFNLQLQNFEYVDFCIRVNWQSFQISR